MWYYSDDPIRDASRYYGDLEAYEEFHARRCPVCGGLVYLGEKLYESERGDVCEDCLDEMFKEFKEKHQTKGGLCTSCLEEDEVLYTLYGKTYCEYCLEEMYEDYKDEYSYTVEEREVCDD